MAQAEPLIRNISDTALLAAVYRARETERPDALFRDVDGAMAMLSQSAGPPRLSCVQWSHC